MVDRLPHKTFSMPFLQLGLKIVEINNCIDACGTNVAPMDDAVHVRTIRVGDGPLTCSRIVRLPVDTQQ
ncbi:hypothetical protein AWB79_05119 [Caballeronia hypogeia]|uniref:Uncharacterized protein n=1 Tax=Caballeronia hypogeia TaxID=1777140 RepID=A0A158CC89_9BURK|nr:hypothetical protein AWB79_05119 [Caballeronia hypogeia]